MVFVLPVQIAHGVSKDVADSINEAIKTILPEDNIIPPIPLHGVPGQYAVVAFVQDSTLPRGHSSTWPEDDAFSNSERHSKHCDVVCAYAQKLCDFAANWMPAQCSRDVRLAVCIPTSLVLRYTEELRQLGNASKYQRSRSVRYDEDAMVATLLDMRYVNPISSENGELLETLFRGTHVLSTFLRVLPSATVEADSPDKCLYNKTPWFQGCEMWVALTEEEKRPEEPAITHRWKYVPNTEFDGLPSVTDAIVLGKIPALLAMPSCYEMALKMVRRIDLL
jgi:hypothetical protein